MMPPLLPNSLPYGNPNDDTNGAGFIRPSPPPSYNSNLLNNYGRFENKSVRLNNKLS
jgi:hypothetical protein